MLFVVNYFDRLIIYLKNLIAKEILQTDFRVSIWNSMTHSTTTKKPPIKSVFELLSIRFQRRWWKTLPRFPLCRVHVTEMSAIIDLNLNNFWIMDVKCLIIMTETSFCCGWEKKTEIHNWICPLRFVLLFQPTKLQKWFSLLGRKYY